MDCGNSAQRLYNNKHIFSCDSPGAIFVHRLRGKVSIVTISSIPQRIMPRFTRENTIEEKRKMRNERNKRKRLLRTEEKREAVGILRQKEKAAYSRAKEMARSFYFKWRQLAEQNKTRTLDRTKVSLYSDSSKTHKQRSIKPPVSVGIAAFIPIFKTLH